MQSRILSIKTCEQLFKRIFGQRRVHFRKLRACFSFPTSFVVWF